MPFKFLTCGFAISACLRPTSDGASCRIVCDQSVTSALALTEPEEDASAAGDLDSALRACPAPSVFQQPHAINQIGSGQASRRSLLGPAEYPAIGALPLAWHRPVHSS